MLLNINRDRGGALEYESDVRVPSSTLYHVVFLVTNDIKWGQVENKGLSEDTNPHLGSKSSPIFLYLKKMGRGWWWELIVWCITEY